MPKISRAQGPTVEGVPPRLTVEGVPPQEFDQHRFFKGGGDDVSAGTSSQPSSPISEPTPERPTVKGNTRPPARTTGNRSK